MRYEAVFDCGDDESLPAWEVVEWTVTNENGRIGKLVDRFYGSEAECEAHEVADLLNQADNLEFDPGCEFDKEIL